MPSSYTSLYYHLIWSTRHREPLISDEIRDRLYEYIGGIIRNHGSCLLAIGGMPDHVHLLADLNKQQPLADVVRDIKAGSSAWIHETFPGMPNFAWQTGYGAFTVSYSGVDAVKAYIANQREHHRIRTFQEEFERFLERHKIAYDPRYLGD